MLVIKHKWRIPHVPILIPLNELSRGESGGITSDSMRIAIMGFVVLGLVYADRINFQRNLAGLHHVAKAGVE